MSFIKVAIAAGALAAFVTSASADVRYAGSPKLGQSYVPDSSMSARAELLPRDGADTSDIHVPLAYMRKGGIGSRGF